MKRFSFSLQKLLDYKEQMFDVERGVLAEMNAVLGQFQRELAELRRELSRGSQELNKKYEQGTTTQEIIRHKNYLSAVGDSIVSKENQIALQRQAIGRQMDKVREAKVEISTIEKLKEKKLEEYRYMEQKSDEQFIEEFVSNQRASELDFY